MNGSHDLLTEPLIQTAPAGLLSLPGVLAALARDEVDSYPALRPHQAPAWHMFLVQLAALSLHGAEREDLPDDEATWRDLLRGLTLKFPNDEPWNLVVEDWTKPAFLQSPVPSGAKLENGVSTPDALDLLITSRNHDLKQAVAAHAGADDWIFALVSLQTGEGYGGSGNQGIARMNGGSSSRALMALAPLPPPGAKNLSPRPGAWWRRDVSILLQRREKQCEDYPQFAEEDGVALVWQEPWPEGEQLRLNQLDIWFVEICRRIRLVQKGDLIRAVKGTSKATRIDGKPFKGALGDPYAPIHKSESKALTLGEGDFDYARLTDLLFSGDWELPLLARPAEFEPHDANLALICAALSRGNSKTDGFKSRCVPVRRQVAESLASHRQQLHELAEAQIEEISKFDKALRFGLALAAAGGERKKIKKEHYGLTQPPRAQFDRAADVIFFPHLWVRFEAQDRDDEARFDAKRAFQDELRKRAIQVFEAALPAMPCAGLFRPRAEARAQRAFNAMIRKEFPLLFAARDDEASSHVA
jgi:CRISPR system Cascade subunit CasA